MALKTKRQLGTEVLKRSRIVGAADTPSAVDLARVTDIYDTKLEEWRSRDLVYWTNTDLATEEIPIEVFDTLVALMINCSESQYGRNTQISQLDRMAIEDRLLRSLRRYVHMQSANLPTSQNYF
jgi:hypothetical protein